jgi:hypothetical protein
MVVPKRWNEEKMLANYTMVLSFTMYNIYILPTSHSNTTRFDYETTLDIPFHTTLTTHQKTFLIQLLKISNP